MIDFNDIATDQLPAIYYVKGDVYWAKNEKGLWQQLNSTVVRRRLTRLGYSPSKKGGEALSLLDLTMDRITQEHGVDYVAELGFVEEGVHVLDGHTFLVTTGMKLLSPAAGEWDTIHSVLYQLLGEEQLAYFLGWLKIAVDYLYTGKRVFGQAVIFVGPTGCGKSLVQDRIITPCLGGRMARPFAWLTGKTEFNSDLFLACHLTIQDEYSSGAEGSREAFSAGLKQLTATSAHRYHQKGRDAFYIVPFWRPTVSLNNEPHNLRVMPHLDSDVLDKLHIFKCEKVFFPELVKDPVTGENNLEAAIRTELPAFLHYLRFEHVIPDEIHTDERYGVKAYWNYEVCDAVNRQSTEAAVVRAIQSMYAGSRVNKTMSDLAQDLTYSSDRVTINRIVSSPTWLLNIMSRLRSRYPERFSFREYGFEQIWTLDFCDIKPLGERY